MNNYLVYIHTNKINNKKYVGITCQKPDRRWRDGDGYTADKQSVFYHAIRKYGWENFSHEVIKDNLSLSEAQLLEQQLIKQFHTYVHDPNSQGYNLTRGGEGWNQIDKDLICKLWDEGKNVTVIAETLNCSKDTVQRTLVNYCNYSIEESRKRAGQLVKNLLVMPINQYDLAGNFIQTFDSISDAARAVNGKEGNISMARDNIKRSAYGYIWRTINSSVPIIYRYRGSKIVEQYDLSGNFIKSYESITQAAKITGINASCISRAATQERRTAGGFKWQFV